MKRKLSLVALVLALLLVGNPAIRQTLAQTGVGNTAAELAGKFLMVRDADETVTGLKSYSRSTNPPFAVNVGAAKVSNLDADKLDGIDSASFVQTGVPSTITTTGTSTALALPSGTGPLVIFANNATLLTIQGITAGTDGQQLTIYSIGAGQVDLVHQSASASAALRLVNFATLGPASAASGTTSLAAGKGVAVFNYDTTSTRWRLRAHEQGGYIDYSATSTKVGYASFTVQKVFYKLTGQQLSVIWYLAGTSNATSTSFTIPYTSTSTGVTGGAGYLPAGLSIDNGASLTSPSAVAIADVSSVVSLSISYGGSFTGWTNSGSKTTAGQMSITIQ